MSDCRWVCKHEAIGRRDVSSSRPCALPLWLWILLVALAVSFGAEPATAGKLGAEPIQEPSPAYRQTSEVEKETKSLLKNDDAASLEDLEQKRRSRKEARTRADLITRIAGGLSGGILAGVCLLVLAIQRNTPKVGVAMFVSCVIAGGLFGTLATLVPAAAFYLHLRKLNLVHPPKLEPTSGWIVLLWVVGLAGACVLLQMGSGVLAVLPELMDGSRLKESELEIMLASSGMSYRICVAAAWLCFLGLMVACVPQERAGWLRRLGLSGIRGWPSAAWIAGAAVLILAGGLGSGPFMDSKSKESLAVIAQGVHSPGWYFFAVVVAAPVIEELTFRGYGFSGFFPKIGAWGAILVPGVIFASYHFQYGWGGLIYVFILGLILGVVRWKTGSVFPCIALHASNNLLSFLASFFR